MFEDVVSYRRFGIFFVGEGLAPPVCDGIRNFLVGRGLAPAVVGGRPMVAPTRDSEFLGRVRLPLEGRLRRRRW